MKYKTIRGLTIFEIIALLASFAYGHGRPQDMTGWMIGAQLALLAILLLRSARMRFLPEMLKSGNAVAAYFIFCVVLLLGVPAGWKAYGFPKALQFSLRHYGTRSSATVKHLQFVADTWRSGELQVPSTADADAMLVKLSYQNHTTTIRINRGDGAYYRTYIDNALDGHTSVRYLSWAPWLVRPESDVYPVNSPSIE